MPRARLLHYHTQPLRPIVPGVRFPPPVNTGFGPFTKPKGLWISVEGPDDWPAWCSSEMPEWAVERATCASQVLLRPGHQVRWLTSAAELDVFTQEYGVYESWPNGFFPADPVIDWPRVYADWQGLIIAPYVWERRLELRWYYGWDCASGCIWDPGSIDQLIDLS